MTNEQQLIKEVVEAADKYALSQNFEVDNIESEEHELWKKSFNKLRDYADSISEDVLKDSFKTRAKMTLMSMEGTNVKFEYQYDNANTPEDNTFSKFTPFGHANFSITNEYVLQNLELGKKYYFDITPVN